MTTEDRVILDDCHVLGADEQPPGASSLATLFSSLSQLPLEKLT